MHLIPLPEEIEKELPAIVKIKGASICLQCRFSRLLCGRPACPILVKLSSYTKMKVAKEVESDSPPSVFVGRFGYPKVYFGPLLPNERGDTRIFDEPEMWHSLSFEKIVNIRMSMVRAKRTSSIEDAKDPKGFLYETQIALLSNSPIYSHITFTKEPRGSVYLDDASPPFGPAADVERYRFGNASSDRRVEKVYYDRQLKSSNAVVDLYESGLSVNSIQRFFSMGMTGIRRKLVPTRWSITAVDDVISKHLLDEVKLFATVDKYSVFVHDMLGSRYVIILCPAVFSFEWVEAWFPNTVWNTSGNEAEAISDHEGYSGRKEYALPGGCYYSARLGVVEYMKKIRRQATVIALREIYPGQLLPLGVWNVREAIREALNKNPSIWDTFEGALSFSLQNLSLPKEFWMEKSYLVRYIMNQKRMENFF